MSEIVCTPPQTNFDRVIAAKRAFRNAREAHKLSRYQHVTWTGTVGLGAASPRSAPQGLQLVETIAKNAAVAARFLIRAITGAHAAAKGGAR